MERRRLYERRLLEVLTVKGKGVTQMGYVCAIETQSVLQSLL